MNSAIDRGGIANHSEGQNPCWNRNITEGNPSLNYTLSVESTELKQRCEVIREQKLLKVKCGYIY